MPNSPAILRYKAEFAKSLRIVEQNLEQFRSGMDLRQGTLSEDLRNFAGSIRQRVRPRSLTPEVEAAYEACIGAFDTALTEWNAQASRVAEGRDFINQFERSIVVMVFGMVNCGKSSLGNYLAQSVCDAGSGPVDLDAFYYDEAGKKCSMKWDFSAPRGYPFEVKETECTGRIQGFTAGGLTWVDTPGVGSMNDKHRLLAQAYAEHAELVVFLTSSDSPLRSSDIKEAMTLVGRGKSILVVVSKFDIARDIWGDDDKLLGVRHEVKDEASRRQQREWIRSQIEEAKLGSALRDTAICFVSTLCASTADCGDKDREYVESGIPEFFGQLASVLRKGPTELKSENPKLRFNAFVQEIVHDQKAWSIPPLTAKLEKIRLDLVNQKDALEAKAAGMSASAAARSASGVGSAFSQAGSALAKNVESPQHIQQRLESAVNEAVRAALRSVLETEIAGFVKEVDAAVLSTIGQPKTSVASIERIQKAVEVSNAPTAKSYGAAIGALVLGTAALFIPFGQGVGAWLLASGAGMAAGAAGGALGGKVGEQFASNKSISVDAGTNADELKAAYLNSLTKQLQPVVEKAIVAVIDVYLKPRLDHIAAVKTACDNLAKKLQQSAYR